MQLPRGLARFNKVVTNRIQGTYAWLLPPYAVVIHRGRRSGRPYRTPVLAFTRGDRLAIPVLYGEDSDWVRNLVSAGRGEVVRGGRRHGLLAPRLVDAAEARRLVPFGGRVARFSGQAVVAKLGPRLPMRQSATRGPGQEDRDQSPDPG
jgi:deazaflavin-dependent oxidoreductase (nitroreductase family)